ncbi:MAG: glycosyltransferase family A protein, partial [Bacteroidota bacterium]
MHKQKDHVETMDHQEFKVREEEVLINVIYVRGTVDRLLPFLTSLVNHSLCQFRLISNGCLAKEQALLQQYADHCERASFFDLKTPNVLPHHDVLMRLLPLEQGPVFAFLDSDILAKGPFLKQLLEASTNHQAVFTGFPLWHERNELKMRREFKILGGRFLHSHHEMLYGFSYAAIYRTAPLRQ